MNTATYTALLANPASITPEVMGELEVILEKYPYFQSARALQLKGLKNENSFLYNDALKVTAAYTTDRDILFEYITSESFVQNEISERILQHSERVRDMEVVSEDVSELVSLELEQQMKAEMKKAEAILDPHLFERKEVPPVTVSEEIKEKETQTPSNQSITPSLEVDAPLPFTRADTHTFGEWLKLTSANPISRSDSDDTAPLPATTEQDEKSKKFELIDKFIQQKPKLEPRPDATKNINLAKPFTKTSDSLMTETLAKVYLQQKNYKKAIQAYKILILKNPEKSGFFADQIRAIQKLIKETK
ncbi:MAG: tetratricopeptide repeat protein [Bacteroidota bacterium]